jgi:flagellar motor protein MotB
LPNSYKLVRIYNLIRKLIIILCLIFYSSSLIVLIATLNIQPVFDRGITDKLAEMGSFQAGSRDQVVGLDDVPGESVERTARNEQEDLTSADQSREIREPILLATFGRGMFPPGQDVANIELSQAVLAYVPTIMKAIPEYNIPIEGHSDSLPIRNSSDSKFADNKELSLMRAKAAASILESAAVPSKFVIIKAYGDARPIASNASPEGRTKNHRIELWLVPVDRPSPNDE